MAYENNEQFDSYSPHYYDDQNDKQYANKLMPEPIELFIKDFDTAIANNNIADIENCYEIGFNALTDRFYKNSEWPDIETAKEYIQSDKFVILYKELYFRHIYARVTAGPTMEQRFDSYNNYCTLFNFIVFPEQPCELELPHQWMWDIIDEFIYQFQAFMVYKTKNNKKTEAELKKMANNSSIWNIHSVLNVLHSLVDKSCINQQLKAYENGNDPHAVAGPYGKHTLYKMLGYFSLIGLLRLHTLLGDYYQALKIVEFINIHDKEMMSRVPACQMSTKYYVGFSYMMMRRYSDAIRIFCDILIYNQRHKHLVPNRSFLYDQEKKQTEQIFTLLSICLSLHPMRIDESLMAILREKTYAEKMMRMSNGDMNEFENCFMFACPKFLTPAAATELPSEFSVNTGGANGHDNAAYTQQKLMFLGEVSQQQSIPVVRSYLKLYTTLPISKLSGLMKHDQLYTQLLNFKHKMSNITWSKGIGCLSGEMKSKSEVDFYIDKDMIHIADTKVARRYGDFFIRQIHKCEELNMNMIKSEEKSV